MFVTSDLRCITFYGCNCLLFAFTIFTHRYGDTPEKHSPKVKGRDQNDAYFLFMLFVTHLGEL